MSTTKKFGEEDFHTTDAIGEEDATTHAVGEEDATTDALGEEEPYPVDESFQDPFGSF